MLMESLFVSRPISIVLAPVICAVATLSTDKIVLPARTPALTLAGLIRLQWSHCCSEWVEKQPVELVSPWSAMATAVQAWLVTGSVTTELMTRRICFQILAVHMYVFKSEPLSEWVKVSAGGRNTTWDSLIGSSGTHRNTTWNIFLWGKSAM